MAAKSKRSSNTPKLTELDGRQLAVDMLRELQQWWADVPDIAEDATAADLDPYQETLINRPPTIMRRYLAAARKGGRKVERGFLCVVSDFIGSASEACTAPEHYERAAARCVDRGTAQ